MLAALDELEPDERRTCARRLLADARGPQTAYARVLVTCVEQDELFAGPVVGGFQAAGLDDEAALATLVALARERGLQATWTDWEEVEDRREARLRLQVLGAYFYVVRDLSAKVAAPPGAPSRGSRVRLRALPGSRWPAWAWPRRSPRSCGGCCATPGPSCTGRWP